MSSKSSEKISVREGLIRIENAERFKAKPEADSHIHVVVMQKAGNSLRHYITLRSANERLSMGEKFWGDYVCYIVDMSLRRTKIDQEFVIRDSITKVRIIADIAYQASDGERVALGVEDALLTLHEEIISFLKRVVGKLNLDQVTEEFLDGRIYQETMRLQSWTGLSVQRVTVSLEWSKEVVERIKERKAKQRKQIEEDRDRQRKVVLEDQDRSRSQRLEKEDIAHVDDLLSQLGLASMPADVKLKLMALPREQAYREIEGFIAKTREQFQARSLEREEREFRLLEKFMNDGTLGEMAMADLGKKLLARHMNIREQDEGMGIDNNVLFGGGSSSSRHLTGGSGSSPKRLPDDLKDTE